jgi:uncharacterized protein
LDTPTIIREVLKEYALEVRGYHGVCHWARVLENGLRLAEETGADARIVTLFALFHDCRRANEARDEGHGLRGGQFARSLRGTLVHLGDSDFELLFRACHLHTHGYTQDEVTVQVCWDADRLDLGRVGITPEPGLLCSQAARDLISWSDRRAVTGYEPEIVSRAWRL